MTGVRVEVGGDHVCRITLDRPDAKNAITPGMREALLAAVREARVDRGVRALLLTGAGDAFCAGMDLTASTLKDVGSKDFDPRTTSEALRRGLQAIVTELWELDKPTIAAVNGAAVGPGAHLALACDFVLACDATRFIWNFARWGLVADAGGAYLLPRLVGMPRAKELLLRGGSIVGADAVREGLALRAYASADELAQEADALAVELAAGATRAIGLNKQLLNSSFESDLGHLLERERHFQALVAGTRDVQEGMAAFREKRDARFEGR